MREARVKPIAWPSDYGPQRRPMLRSDLKRVIELETAAYDIPWNHQNFEDCLKAKNACSLFFSGDHILGHSIVSYVLDEAHLLNICIDPRYAGRGYGRFYLKQLIREAHTHSCHMFFLEVRASNHKALHLYRSEGFNEVGVRKHYYPALNGREDAVLMTLDLSIDGYA